MDIKKIQEQLARFADERDWDQFHNPKNLAMALSVEASELVEIFQWLTPEQSAAVMQSSESVHVGEEVADILIYLLRLADKLDIDLEQVVAEKVRKNAKKHPVASRMDKGEATVEKEVSRGCSIISIGGAGSNFIESAAGMSCDRIYIDQEDDRQLDSVTFVDAASASRSGWGRIKALVCGSGTIFLQGGLGGDTATSMIPSLAEVLLEDGHQVVVMALLPFDMEGRSRRQQAQRGLEQLKQLDGVEIHLYENERLMKEFGGDCMLSEAFAYIDRHFMRIVEAGC
ncbi:MAG: hypothetical protein HN421_11885 [Gammaproteobacteria bacterium]|jgi:NTP pyrophosphatase (non-canonical NTP hydrolase)|nr:hypothetical protein [Gammaproteobacteria bacterium]MBT4079762.1 hypothetical protein [Gammaproteobacteria bacterium]MBT5747166.1 hypothetical protein [Gammaproteobacteria bacterium]MBT7229460.1 hypothetical protein [Gammaproteobacteria bacterium]